MRSRVHSVLMFIVAVGLAGCSPSPLSEEKIKSDLIGKEFPLTPYGKLRIDANDLKGLRVTKRMTDSKRGTDMILIAVDVGDAAVRASGELKVTYRLYDQGWLLDTVEPTSKIRLIEGGKEGRR